MKRFFALCGGGLLAVLLLAVAVRAEEIKNQYYTLDLPPGWKVNNKSVHYGTVSREKERGLDDVKKWTVTVVLGVADSSRQNGVSIVVSTLPEITSAKEICTMNCHVLDMSGYEVGEPVAVGESYMVEFSQGEEHGVLYATTTGKLASTVSFTGDGGKELLQKRFKPVDPKLFPASYEGVLIQPH